MADISSQINATHKSIICVISANQVPRLILGSVIDEQYATSLRDESVLNHFIHESSYPTHGLGKNGFFVVARNNDNKFLSHNFN